MGETTVTATVGAGGVTVVVVTVNPWLAFGVAALAIGAGVALCWPTEGQKS